MVSDTVPQVRVLRFIPSKLTLCKIGSRGRVLGAILLDLALVSLWGATLYGGWTFAGGFAALKHKFGL